MSLPLLICTLRGQPGTAPTAILSRQILSLAILQVENRQIPTESGKDGRFCRTGDCQHGRMPNTAFHGNGIEMLDDTLKFTCQLHFILSADFIGDGQCSGEQSLTGLPECLQQRACRQTHLGSQVRHHETPAMTQGIVAKRYFDRAAAAECG